MYHVSCQSHIIIYLSVQFTVHVRVRKSGIINAENGRLNRTAGRGEPLLLAIACITKGILATVTATATNEVTYTIIILS